MITVRVGTGGFFLIIIRLGPISPFSAKFTPCPRGEIAPVCIDCLGLRVDIYTCVGPRIRE